MTSRSASRTIVIPMAGGLARQTISAAAQVSSIAEPFPLSPVSPTAPVSPPFLPPGVPIHTGSTHLPTGVKVHPGLAAANRAIDAKVSEPQVASLAGAPLGGIEQISGGWVRRYQGCDIYFSPATGAHEVHGDIKAKYDAIAGPAGRLGFPTTDENVSPDKVGRYNYFCHGAIFWTSHTGPMAMGREVVDKWISYDAQNDLGYPVRDQYHFALVTPAVEWCEFENGAIVQMPDNVLKARAVAVPPDRLRNFIRSMFDSQVHKTGDNIGLKPNVETVEVGSWGWGFWASTPRDITLRLHGFHDNGLAPDTNFAIDVGLAFEVVGWDTTPSFGEQMQKTLVAQLTYLRVKHEGSDADEVFYPTVGGKVVTGVAKGIYKAFYPDTWPDPDHPEVPNGSVFVVSFPVMSSANSVDILDVIATEDGGIQVLINPLPAVPVDIGLFRQQKVQQAVDNLIP